MGRIKVDDKEWPVVVIDFSGYRDKSDTDALIETIKALGMRGRFGAIGLIDDLDASAADRKYMVEQISDLQIQYYICEAIVTDSMAKRGLFTAYSWIRGERPYKTKVFPTREKATKWTQNEIAGERKQSQLVG